jgi:hypothetical protein
MSIASSWTRNLPRLAALELMASPYFVVAGTDVGVMTPETLEEIRIERRLSWLHTHNANTQDLRLLLRLGGEGVLRRQRRSGNAAAPPSKAMKSRRLTSAFSPAIRCAAAVPANRAAQCC